MADIPVDLYFVLDSSSSMKTFSKKLAGASEDITDEIQKLTRDFRLGFGSFIEKPRIPFTKGKISKAYAFHHIMNLTKNSAKEFKGKVDAQIETFQTNIDIPEAGLDAIAQAMLCPQIIGWEEDRKKIIIVMTDAEMHFAFDGILGGITDKFPMKECLLDNGSYDSKQNDYDYPSFGQVIPGYFSIQTRHKPLINVNIYRVIRQFLVVFPAVFDQFSGRFSKKKNCGIQDF